MTEVGFAMHRGPAQAATRACACADCFGERGGLQRRAFLALGAAAGLAATQSLVPGVARAEEKLGPDAALAKLMAGNDRYVKNEMTSFKADLAALRAQTYDKQSPFATVLACADSRVPVELIFDQSIGSIFVARVAGNIADAETIASLEYGAADLEISVILVLGHERCGAVKAAMSGEAVPGQISALFAPLQPAVARGGHDWATTAKLNAKIQAGLLATASPVLAERIAKGELKIAAGYYELRSGRVLPL